MNQQKLSVSVPRPLAKFIEEYRREHNLKTKSSVVERALEALRDKELEQAYALASQENDPAWDATIADGLPHELW